MNVTCPGGVVNSPDHFINWVDVHCAPYSGFQLFLFAGGCLMWVLAYAIIVHNAFKLRFVDMAAVAAYSNFAWEFVWSFPFRTDMGWFLVYTYRAWWFLDIVIIWKTFQYGSQLYRDGLTKRYYKAFSIGCIATFGAIYYTFVAQGLDESIGATSAYICQLLLSWACLWMLLANPEERRFSLTVAWLKGYGTAMNTVFMYIHYPQNHLIQVLGTVAFVVDNLYIWVLWKRLRHAAPSAEPVMSPAE